jgi:glycosyltransferase involved in cell wall biosynthesis
MLSSGNVWLAGGGLYGGDLGAKVVVFSELVVGAARRRGWDFGIIHAHDWMTFPAALALRAASGRPLVVHIHSLEFDRAGGRRGGWIYEIERRAMEAAERVVPVSRYTAGIIERDYGIDSAKIRPVHNGVEPVAAFRSEKRFPEPLVLFVGRLTGQKGPEVFVEIAARVAEHNPNVRFAMAGEGEKLARLLESRSELGLDEKFHFTGFLDREGVRKLYSMADVYCMPSLSEPFGLSALEAAQFGVPVVLSKQSGAAEVLDGALLADGQDAETMARHIDRLLGDERLRAEVVGRQRSSLAQATWETAARGVGAVYREMVG